MSANEQIEQIIKNNEIVLFMKGSRMFPQCGFSAKVTEILKTCGVKFKDVNVLADPTIRQGIKDYSNWPTIPQCYIGGEFIGGCDIMIEMFENGELHKKLGVDAPAPASTEPPKLSISDTAAKAFGDALGEASGEVLRFDVAAGFRYDLYIGPAKQGDLICETNGLSVHVSSSAASMIDGTTIDFIDGPDGAGFKVDNPNEEPSVKDIAPAAVKAKLDASEAFHLFDVRGDKERAIAQIAGAKPLDSGGIHALGALPKDALIVILCHHGVRSRQAGQQLLAEGFRNVHSLRGGIDAWSLEVDNSIARY
jgi:monothiol glutaredoxin